MRGTVRKTWVEEYAPVIANLKRLSSLSRIQKYLVPCLYAYVIAGRKGLVENSCGGWRSHCDEHGPYHKLHKTRVYLRTCKEVSRPGVATSTCTRWKKPQNLVVTNMPDLSIPPPSAIALPRTRVGCRARPSTTFTRLRRGCSYIFVHRAATTENWYGVYRITRIGCTEQSY